VVLKKQKQGLVFVDDSDTANKRLSISMRAVRNVAAAAVFLTAVFLVAFPGSNRNGIADNGDTVRIDIYTKDGKNYIIPVSDTQSYKQFGNSVAVTVIHAIANNIIDILDTCTKKEID